MKERIADENERNAENSCRLVIICTNADIARVRAEIPGNGDVKALEAVRGVVLARSLSVQWRRTIAWTVEKNDKNRTERRLHY